MPGTPTVEEVRAYLRVPATALSDEDLARMYAGEVEVQGRRCRWETPAGEQPDDTRPDALAQALLRRTQREVAARNLPLGVLGDAGEFGPQRIPFLDSVVEKLEGPWRVVVFG